MSGIPAFLFTVSIVTPGTQYYGFLLMSAISSDSDYMIHMITRKFFIFFIIKVCYYSQGSAFLIVQREVIKWWCDKLNDCGVLQNSKDEDLPAVLMNQVMRWRWYGAMLNHVVDTIHNEDSDAKLHFFAAFQGSSWKNI